MPELDAQARSRGRPSPALPRAVSTAWRLLAAALGAAVLALVVAPAPAGAKAGKAKLDLELERTPVIVKNSYMRLPPIGPRGGMGRNLKRRGFSLAHQHLGDVYVRAGIVRRQPRLIRKGFRAFGYAFRRQRSDGSFPEKQAEGYAFFVEAVAHSMLLLKRTPYKRRFQDRIRAYKKRLRRAADHMLVPTAWKGFKDRNPQYTHSGFSTGTALALTGKLVRNKRLQRYGRRAVRLALQNQRDTGVNPELGGYDVRYHMAGITYAQRYRVYFPGGRVKRGIDRMTTRGLRWMSRRIAGNGYIKWRGSSRTCRERNSNGELKTPGYGFAVRGFAYWGTLKKRPRWVRMARRIDPYPGAAGGSLCGPRKAVSRSRGRRGGRGGDEGTRGGSAGARGGSGARTRASDVRASGDRRAEDRGRREGDPDRHAGDGGDAAGGDGGDEQEGHGGGAGSGAGRSAERASGDRARGRGEQRRDGSPPPPLVLGGAALAVAMGARVRSRQRRRQFMFANRRRGSRRR